MLHRKGYRKPHRHLRVVEQSEHQLLFSFFLQRGIKKAIETSFSIDCLLMNQNLKAVRRENESEWYWNILVVIVFNHLTVNPAFELTYRICLRRLLQKDTPIQLSYHPTYAVACERNPACKINYRALNTTDSPTDGRFIEYKCQGWITYWVISGKVY